MNTTNGTLDKKFLECVEQYWGFGLPKDYKKFILAHNGGEPKYRVFDFKDVSDGSCLAEFYGFVKNYSTNILLHQKQFSDRYPDNMLPIADDCYGNRILLSVKGSDYGKVYFWDHEMEADPDQGEVPSYDNLTLIADSFEEFVGNLRDESELDELLGSSEDEGE